MYRPRPRPNASKLDDIEAQISALITEIKASDLNKYTSEELSDEKGFEILEKEIADLKDFIAFETEVTKKLTEEHSRLSEQIQEEERTISCFEEFMKGGLFSGEEVLDVTKETYSKLEVLEAKICRLIKKFTRKYLSDNACSYFRSDVCTEEEGVASAQKSLLDILKCLIPLLNLEQDTDFVSQLKVDDTIKQSHIVFLLDADIIEPCEDDPSCFKLKE